MPDAPWGDQPSFIGRHAELEALAVVLATHQIVTLTGPGGTGKTRLALELVGPVAAHARLVIVELASVTDRTAVAAAVTAAADVRPAAGESPADALARAFSDEAVVLVVDNCEHVLESVAEFIASVVTRCPGLRIVATSREALHIDAEFVWPVPPLAMPPDEHTPVDSLGSHDAIRLFVDRAGRARPGFALTSDNAAAVISVCRRCDALPLAIELAAAWATVLTVEGIAESLDRDARLLVARARDAPERHRTLAATVEWSFQLLDAREQRTLCQLSVFAGGWTLEAAEVVAAEDGDSATAVITSLGRLIDASLVAPASDDDGRFRMLEAVRAFAVDRLGVSEDALGAQRRHLMWTISAAEKFDFLLQHEHENVRVAIRYAIDQRLEDEAMRLCLAASNFWEANGHYDEGRSWLLMAFSEQGDARLQLETLLSLCRIDRAAGRFDDAMGHARRAAAIAAGLGGSAVAQVEVQIGSTLIDSRDLPGAVTPLEKAIATWRELGDNRALSATLSLLSYATLRTGDLVGARLHIEEAVALARQLGDRYETARALIALGHLAADSSDLDGAQAAFQESLGLLEALGDATGARVARWSLACTLRKTGEFGAARQLFCQYLEEARQLGVTAEIGAALNSLGGLARQEGDSQTASGHFHQALALMRGAQHREGIALLCENLGLLAVDAGETSRARAYFVEAFELWTAMGITSSANEVANAIAELAEPSSSAVTATQEDSVLRHEGDVWTFEFDGRAVRLRDTKGVHYLAFLLRHPHRDVGALDLAAMTNGAGVQDAIDAPALDATARAAYIARLRELRDDLEEFEANHDSERASRAHIEMEFLASELAGAIGLGGRNRRSGSPGERARLNVTRAIQVVTRKLGVTHPALGDHLAYALHTGTFCSYMPDPRSGIAWRQEEPATG